MILSIAATDFAGASTHDREPTSEKRTQVLMVDISRAFFNANTSSVDPIHV